MTGYEAMNMIRKGQIQGVTKGDIVTQVNFVAQIFRGAAYTAPTLADLLWSKSFCNTTLMMQLG